MFKLWNCPPVHLQIQMFSGFALDYRYCFFYKSDAFIFFFKCLLLYIMSFWLTLKLYNYSPFVHRRKEKNSYYMASEKVYFRSQILERPSIGEYWNFFGVPVLPENVIFTFFRTCWCYSEAYNTGTQKWSRIVQYSCTSIRDLKYTFSMASMQMLYSWLDCVLTCGDVYSKHSIYVIKKSDVFLYLVQLSVTYCSSLCPLVPWKKTFWELFLLICAELLKDWKNSVYYVCFEDKLYEMTFVHINKWFF